MILNLRDTMEKIKNLRKDLKLTQQQAAKKAKMHQADWSRAERAVELPITLYRLSSMAKAVGMEVELKLVPKTRQRKRRT